MWAGTNAGYVYIYQLHLPSDDRRHTDTVDCVLGEEMPLSVLICCVTLNSIKVITTLENLDNIEISGNLLILKNSGNLKYTRGIFVHQMLFFVAQSETQQANMYMCVCMATMLSIAPCSLKIYSVILQERYQNDC